MSDCNVLKAVLLSQRKFRTYHLLFPPALTASYPVEYLISGLRVGSCTQFTFFTNEEVRSETIDGKTE